MAGLLSEPPVLVVSTDSYSSAPFSEVMESDEVVVVVVHAGGAPSSGDSGEVGASGEVPGRNKGRVRFVTFCHVSSRCVTFRHVSGFAGVESQPSI